MFLCQKLESFEIIIHDSFSYYLNEARIKIDSSKFPFLILLLVSNIYNVYNVYSLGLSNFLEQGSITIITIIIIF